MLAPRPLSVALGRTEMRADGDDRYRRRRLRSPWLPLLLSEAPLMKSVVVRLGILLTCGLLAVSFAPQAQQSGAMYRIGWLHPSATAPRATLRDALRELGYVEGRTITFETRLAEDKPDRLPGLAADLVRSRPDVIVAISPLAIRAAKQATNSIPIVMAYWGGPDLVESGIVASLARPGGNITGIHMLNTALEPKRLELLLEAVPREIGRASCRERV